MAEALHSLLDIVSSFVTFLGIKTAEKPADEHYPYGYSRYEGVASLVVVFLLFVTAAWILYEGVMGLINQDSTAEFSIWGIIIMAGSVIINEILARAKFYIGNKNSSIALVADAEHSRADVISSLAVLVGLVLIKFYPLADSILAILVALYIFYEAYELSKESIDSLVDKANPEVEQKIKEGLAKMGVKTKEIKTRKIGASNFADISLLFDPREKAEEISQKTDDIENTLLSKIPELKQISINVKSHDIKRQTTKPRFFGGRFRFGRGIQLIGPKKPKTKSGKTAKRVVIPIENNDMAKEFGSNEYLIIDVDKNGNVIKKTRQKNPYFEPEGMGHGAKFIKSVSADKIITKHLGENARRNLEALDIEIEIAEPEKKLEDLNIK
jgi:cation diffusion facilitator family transporter